MTQEEMQKRILELEAQFAALNSYNTIPLDVGEAMKARIVGQNNFAVGQSTGGAPATITVVERDGANPPVNYTVAAPFAKQLIIRLGEQTYTVPAN